MVATLPRYMVLKSRYNAKYLSYVKEDEQIHGFLQFSGEEVLSPYAKFKVDLAEGGNGLVHIRCCYNNKYWARKSDDQSWSWIVAGAHQPGEDQSECSCTLFEPVYVDDKDPAQGVRFRHVQLGHNACLWRLPSQPQNSCLMAAYGDPDKDLCDVFLLVDWETLLALPKHVAFKGDNGKYLFYSEHPYLQFLSDDIGQSNVGNEVFSNGDGSVRIKCNLSGKFWKRGSNWIVVNANLDGNENNRDLLFWPIKLHDNKVALRNLGNNNFCVRSNADGFFNCLNAAEPSITKEARMELEELVESRSIYNVNFRLLDSRIYNETVVTMATREAINQTQEQNTLDLKLSYKDTKSSTWDTSFSVQLGLKTTVKAGIPWIAEGEIEISAEFGVAHQWGETNTTESEVETVYKVAVPPMRMVKVRLMATTGSCDVPYSYTRRDTLTNGEQVTYTMDDGVYTGVNSYNFTYISKEFPVEIDDLDMNIKQTTLQYT